VIEKSLEYQLLKGNALFDDELAYLMGNAFFECELGSLRGLTSEESTRFLGINVCPAADYRSHLFLAGDD